MRRVYIRLPVSCLFEKAVKDRINRDVIPFTTCRGIDVRCVANAIKVTAVCPIGEGSYFYKLVRHEMRKPLLSGRRKR